MPYDLTKAEHRGRLLLHASNVDGTTRVQANRARMALDEAIRCGYVLAPPVTAKMIEAVQFHIYRGERYEAERIINIVRTGVTE
jgi:hypothetical protein